MYRFDTTGQMTMLDLDTAERGGAPPKRRSGKPDPELVSIPYFHLDLLSSPVDLFGQRHWEFRSPWREGKRPLNTGAAPRRPIRVSLSGILEAYLGFTIKKIGGTAMAEKTRNLCAEIPLELHTKVRQRQAESGETLSRYMTALITKYYEMEENVKMDKDNVRTVAFQVPTELFEQLKAYLKRNGIKQNAFFLDCIRQALAKDAGAAEE